MYSETDLGGTVSLTRALWSDYLIGKVSYTLEDVGIHIKDGYHLPYTDSNGNEHVSQAQGRCNMFSSAIGIGWFCFIQYGRGGSFNVPALPCPDPEGDVNIVWAGYL